ncbi:plasma membrane-associated cation-binding protein 1-like [Cicer arietinum]|uniref:Plasma membrane intrinsic polypeptide n=1 Tax=Cicer arietinum TaxID=3827 RepID=Q9SMK5_CICAR|nr:plasma membrane-associated cation-binding protein 1-like [Cicer arietinum]CAB61742.1 plasma membrane intrinsic polypeptide [Cicer arietinum]
MGYWKSKVLPKIKKVFVSESSTKKAAAAEVSKSFDESKEVYNKEFEEKKTELQPKVLVVYEALSTQIKSLVKERDEAGLKKNTTEVNKFIEELVKIDFPGSKAVSEASSKFGPALISGPIFYVFEKVSTFIVTEEKVEETTPTTETKTEEETSGVKEKEIVIEEGKKEEKIESVEEKVVADPVSDDKQEEKVVETVVTAVEKEEPIKP